MERDSEPTTVTVLRRDGTVVEIASSGHGLSRITVEVGNRKCTRLTTSEVASNHEVSPQFARIVKQMTELLTQQNGETT